MVITDEVYEHLAFDDARSPSAHVPLATLPGMRERTLTLSSAGKSLLASPAGRSAGPPGPARAGRRGARRQAVADVHVRLAAAARRRARARRRVGLPGCARRGPAVAARPARAPAWPTAGLDRPGARGHLLRDHGHQSPRLGRRPRSSASRCPSAPAWSRSPTRPSTTTRTPAGTSSAGRSARRPTSSRRAYAAWPPPTSADPSLVDAVVGRPVVC